jgi:hypothetical protein
LEDNWYVRQCGLIGRFFRIDPIVVADTPDFFTLAFRTAAYNVVAQIEKEAEEKRLAAAKAKN